MNRWRIAMVAGLLLFPVLVLAGVGSYFLWAGGWGFYVWWPLTASMALGYFLGWYWQRKRQLLAPLDWQPQDHWTERDAQAWRVVEGRAKAAEKLEAAVLSDPQQYMRVAQEMTYELAAVYNPGSADPVSHLTIPEMLAVVELASHDLAEMIDRYLPGGHLLTVRDWRRARQAVDWYQSANKVYWMVAALFSPVNTGIRYAASQVGLSTPLQMLQQNLLLWFYTAYLHRLGTYLIELNSGRLRVGATRYRQLMTQTSPVATADGAAQPAAPEPAEAVRQVTITLMGQVKAGKSSLINALLGAQRAVTDVLPVEHHVERYELQPRGVPSRLVLLDTTGYGHAGAKEDQLAATRRAAQEADLVFLVMHAKNPGRQADVDLLDALRNHFNTHPELKRPGVLGVLTHIDLLSPSLEWSPPYQWRQPKRPKEITIRDAVAAVREQLGERVVEVVPVCTATGKVYGMAEDLLPAVATRLDEAHGVALLRALRAEADAAKIRKVFHQLLAAGKEAALIALQSLVRK
jgi:predicted GTPase